MLLDRLVWIGRRSSSRFVFVEQRHVCHGLVFDDGVGRRPYITFTIASRLLLLLKRAILAQILRGVILILTLNYREAKES